HKSPIAMWASGHAVSRCGSCWPRPSRPPRRPMRPPSRSGCSSASMRLAARPGAAVRAAFRPPRRCSRMRGSLARRHATPATCSSTISSSIAARMAARRRPAYAPRAIASAWMAKTSRSARRTWDRRCRAGSPAPSTAPTSWMRAFARPALPLRSIDAVRHASTGWRTSAARRPDRLRANLPAAASLAAWLAHQAQLRLELLPALRVGLEAFLVADRRHDDDILAGLPVHGRCDFELVGELQRIDDAQDLVEVAPGAGRIIEREAHLPVGIDENTLRTVKRSLAFG